MTDRAPRALAVLALLLTLVLVVAPGTAGATTAPGGGAATPTTVLSRGDEMGNSLPKPDSGVAPQRSGDRGGSAQVALFALTLAGTAFIGLMIAREVRKGRRRLEASRT